VADAFRRDGYSSLTALLKHRMSLHPGGAQRLVSRANGLGPYSARGHGLRERCVEWCPG
jgi:hypothetical protein